MISPPILNQGHRGVRRPSLRVRRPIGPQHHRGLSQAAARTGFSAEIASPISVRQPTHDLLNARRSTSAVPATTSALETAQEPRSARPLNCYLMLPREEEYQISKTHVNRLDARMSISDLFGQLAVPLTGQVQAAASDKLGPEF
jgi:hypothetical protein